MIFVRPVTPADIPQFSEWYSKHDSFDPSIFQFPETYVLCAFKDKVIGYMPVQALSFVSTQVLDSLVMNPDATNLEIAGGMRELFKHAITIGYLKDCGEMYFIGNHPETNSIAERYFEKVEYPVYRLRLKDLEPKE